MSKCDYNILPTISSFGWMSCYVNTKNDKKVYISLKQLKNSGIENFTCDKFILL